MKRLPIIRHIRFFYHAYMLDRHLRAYRSMGLGYGVQQSDLDTLDKIWKGEA